MTHPEIIAQINTFRATIANTVRNLPAIPMPYQDAVGSVLARDVQTPASTIPQGTRLNETHMAIMAAAGHTTPLVSRAPIVIHIAIGDELIPADTTPIENQIRDSHSPMLAAMLLKAGAKISNQFQAADNPNILQALTRAALTATADMLLFSISPGTTDTTNVRSTLQKLGFEIHFASTELTPCSPIIFASRPGCLAFVLPGDLLGHYTAFRLFITHALSLLQGETPASTFFHVRLAAGALHTASPNRIRPCLLTVQTGNLVVELADNVDAPEINILSKTNALGVYLDFNNVTILTPLGT